MILFNIVIHCYCTTLFGASCSLSCQLIGIVDIIAMIMPFLAICVIFVELNLHLLMPTVGINTKMCKDQSVGIQVFELFLPLVCTVY